MLITFLRRTTTIHVKGLRQSWGCCCTMPLFKNERLKVGSTVQPFEDAFLALLRIVGLTLVCTKVRPSNGVLPPPHLWWIVIRFQSRGPFYGDALPFPELFILNRHYVLRKKASFREFPFGWIPNVCLAHWRYWGTFEGGKKPPHIEVVFCMWMGRGQRIFWREKS